MLLFLLFSFSLGIAEGGGIYLALAQEPQATVTVESKEVQAGEQDTVAVTVSDVPGKGLVSFQGTISYDPAVLEVVRVEFSDRFPVRAFTVENGTVRFAATTKQTRTPVKSGELFRLVVRAVGEPGAQTILTPTFEIFHDLNYQPIPHITVEGTITIIPSVNELPQASFEFSPQSPSTRDVIQFTDTSVDPDGEVVKWEWDFGDGTTSTEQNPTHRYEKSGVYTVTLTVTDDRDGTGTATARFYVFPAPPENAAGVIAYPNPASTRAKFRYFLPDGTTAAQLVVYDLVGRLVLLEDLSVTGREFVWDLRDLGGNPVQNGPYFYRVRATTPRGVIRSRVEVLIVQR